jgi:uncharacterized protein YbcI
MKPPTLETHGVATGESQARDISRAMVGLFKEHVGRGPTVAKTYIHDDLVICMLHDTMTKAEKTLTDEDKGDEVRQIRRSFQGLFREQASAEVERVVGRKVIAFLSDHAVEPDWAIEAFVLEPGRSA